MTESCPTSTIVDQFINIIALSYTLDGVKMVLCQKLKDGKLIIPCKRITGRLIETIDYVKEIEATMLAYRLQDSMINYSPKSSFTTQVVYAYMNNNWKNYVWVPYSTVLDEVQLKGRQKDILEKYGKQFGRGI